MLQTKTNAFILEKDPGYNNDGFLLLFTQDYGIIRVTASGIYKSGAKLGAWTEPPSYICAHLVLSETPSSSGRLLTLSLKNYLGHVKTGYENISWYFFYVFILRKFTPFGIPINEIFELWKEVLTDQESYENNSLRDINFVYFLSKMLMNEGLAPNWSTCINCGYEWENNENSYFTPRMQGLICNECLKKIGKNLSLSEYGHSSKDDDFYSGCSLDFMTLLPVNKKLTFPAGFFRVSPEERNLLEICAYSDNFKNISQKLFPEAKINDQVCAKVRNFMLIFLGTLL